MPKLNYAFFCNYGMISTEGLPSFISVFSGFKVNGKFPIKKDVHAVVNISVTEEDNAKGDKKLKIVALNPSGKIIGSAEIMAKIDKDNEARDIGYIIPIEGVSFLEKGIHIFEVLFDEKKIGETTLFIDADE